MDSDVLISTAAQGTPEWLKARCGKITASKFGLLAAPKRGKKLWSDSAMSYAYELVAERTTGTPTPSGSWAATEWGNAHEENARLEFEKQSGLEVMAAPFMTHPLFSDVGASCDGLVGDRHTLEIKSPYTTWRHIRTACVQQVPDEYVAQVQGQLWVTGREVAYFASYDPRNPVRDLVYFEAPRDPDYIKAQAERVIMFRDLVKTLEETFRG